MKKLILIFCFILTSWLLHSQNTDNFPCETLNRSSDMKIEVSGLMDHNELEISWIKNEVNRDSVSSWLHNYFIESEFDMEKLDEIDKEIIKQTESWIESKTENIYEFIEESDRIFYYTTPEEYWYSLAGQSGFIILRDCIVVRMIILSQS